MPDTTPTAELCAAAALLREAASHATPGPWRTHDTWIDHGGHTATVLTDRPDINDTELVAWLPTMSNQPWDEARNAWRNAGWMALMGPRVGLALAEWLESTALTVDAVSEKYTPTAGDHWIAPAVGVARQVLGTTDQQPETAEVRCTCGGKGLTHLHADTHEPTAQQPETAPTDRRARYAAAIREADGWVLDDGQHMLDAVMAVADTERENDRLTLENNSRYIKRLDTDYDSLRAELEAHRLALSDALGLGTGAPWDAIRDAAAGYRRTLAEADQRKQEYKQACIRLRAEVEQLRTDRAAVLRELADEAEESDGHITKQELRRMAALEDRRLADEAQQPETEAHPTEVTWIGEIQESDGLWGYLRADRDRAVVEKRTAQQQKRFPTWNDGTPIRTRTVRKVTTYTVATEEQPETEAAPECSAGLLPATDAAVDRCVRRGKHDSHVTAAGVRWGSGSEDEQPETEAAKCTYCGGNGVDPDDEGDYVEFVHMHDPGSRGPCPKCNGTGRPTP